MRWTTLTVALAAMMAVGSGVGAQAPTKSEKDAMMEKERMTDKSGAMPENKRAMDKSMREKDKMKDTGAMPGKEGVKDTMMEKKP